MGYYENKKIISNVSKISSAIIITQNSSKKYTKRSLNYLVSNNDIAYIGHLRKASLYLDMNEPRRALQELKSIYKKVTTAKICKDLVFIEISIIEINNNFIT